MEPLEAAPNCIVWFQAARKSPELVPNRAATNADQKSTRSERYLKKTGERFTNFFHALLLCFSLFPDLSISLFTVSTYLINKLNCFIDVFDVEINNHNVSPTSADKLRTQAMSHERANQSESAKLPITSSANST